MKKLRLGIVLILAIVLSGCSDASAWKTSSMEKGLDSSEITDNKISAGIMEMNVSQDTQSITIEYTNKTGTKYLYGREPRLEVRVDGNWYVVATKEGIAWNMVGILLMPDEANLYTEEFTFLYDYLRAGHYRYIKTFTGFSGDDPQPVSGMEPVIVSVEFDINQN